MKPNLENENFFLHLIQEGKLKVTRKGHAFNLVTGKELGKPTGAYYRKLSWKNHDTGKIQQVQLHRLVWAHFRGIPEDPTLVINHKDGFKPNCSLSNLELVSMSTNSRHAHQTGLVKVLKGEEQGLAVFSDKQVVLLRKKYRPTRAHAQIIADRYGCVWQTALAMLKGNTYFHLNS